MAILLQKKYLFRIDVKKTTLTYRGVVKEMDSNFITFVDENNELHNFNFNSIIEYTLIDEVEE